MKSLNYLLLSLMLLLVYSCSVNNNRENVKYFEDFPVTKSLKGNKIPEIRNDFFSLSMGLKDSLLVFNDYDHDPYFHIYTLPEFKYLGSFGRQGKGPTDIDFPVFWNQIIKSKNSYLMWIFQLDLMKLTLIDINKYLSNNESEPERVIVMPPEIEGAVNIISLNDTIFIGTGYESKGEFFVYNKSNEDFEWRQYIVGNDADFNEKLREYKLLSEYKLGIIKIKPDQTRFVKSFVYSPVIDVYDMNTEMVFSIVLENFEKPKINTKIKQFEPETKVYYANVFLTDKYIYTLNMNCKLSDMSKDNCKNVEIDVFNWEGKAVCKYKLNEGIVASGTFVVDEANKKIYTINPKADDDYYGVFEIGGELSGN